MRQFRIHAYSPAISPAYRHRLLSLGLRPGVRFDLLRSAPLGDPLHIRSGNSELVVRRQDLALLELREELAQ